jgi:hypothetical protein
MQFALEVVVLEFSFLEYSQGILGVKLGITHALSSFTQHITLQCRSVSMKF